MDRGSTQYQPGPKSRREDTELVDHHNRTINAFLDQAIDMHSKCLEATDDFDGDATIRLSSGSRISRIPQYSKKSALLSIESPLGSSHSSPIGYLRA